MRPILNWWGLTKRYRDSLPGEVLYFQRLFSSRIKELQHFIWNQNLYYFYNALHFVLSESIWIFLFRSIKVEHQRHRKHYIIPYEFCMIHTLGRRESAERSRKMPDPRTSRIRLPLLICVNHVNPAMNCVMVLKTGGSNFALSKFCNNK